MHYAVTSCMRDEAMFILEWVAHQRIIGFRTIIVVTNDCTDGTDEICDELAAHDPDFIHVKSQLNPGDLPQIKGMEQVFALPVLEEVDYLLHCDADEFTHIDCGKGRVEDLIAETHEPDCIALAWRPFGDSGIKKWSGGLVTETCQHAATQIRPAFLMHKSLFKPTKFSSAHAHMPKGPRLPNVNVVNALGESLPNRSLYHPRHARYRGTDFDKFTWKNACINHYAIRSEDTFLMKNLRGDAMLRETPRYCINSKFWRRNNRNDVHVPIDPTYLSSLKMDIAALRQNKRVSDLEEKAFQNFLRQREAYLTPKTVEMLTV